MENRRNKRASRRVVFQPATYRGLQRGINQIVGAVRPTLGPLPRVVAIHQVATNAMPELASKGGIIARRIIQLPDKDADMGAMLVRNMLWQLHERYGDGTATAAVVCQTVVNQGVAYIASGGNAMMLRRHLERGTTVLMDELDRQTIHMEGRENLTRIAYSVSGDEQLSAVLGEVFDIIGEYGQLEVRPLRSRDIRREYEDGMVWKSKPFSREMVGDIPRARVVLENPAILISDLEFEEPRQLLPLLELVAGESIPSLLVIANKMTPAAVSLLLANRQPDRLLPLAVRTPGPRWQDEIPNMQDLAILTGGRPFLKATKDTLDRVRLSDLGRARRAWVEAERFGIVAGAGDPRLLRKHIRDLRAQFDRAHKRNERERIRTRIGKFMGGVATVRVGGVTQIEIETRKELAEVTAGSLRAAIRGGVLPGGGVALLACRPALKRLHDQAADADERTAYRILLEVAEAPFRAILHNAGYDGSEALADLKYAGPGHGFDVVSGRVVDMVQASIVDVAEVYKAAVEMGIMTAAMALTIDVLVHRKRPPEVLRGT